MSLTNGDYVRIPLASDLDEKLEFRNLGESQSQFADDVECKHGYFSVQYYRPYFNVDTKQVVHRLMCAVLPNSQEKLVSAILRPHTDLYGPFWVVSTLVLAVSIVGNVADYFLSRDALDSWFYDFSKVTFASILIYSYWMIAPTALYCYIRLRKCSPVTDENITEDQDLSDSYVETSLTTSVHSKKCSIFDFLSIYGYSMTAFIPVVILWSIRSSILQWLLLVMAVIVSGIFLALTLPPIMEKYNKSKLTKPIIVAVIILHCLFAFALMATFFHGPRIQHVTGVGQQVHILSPLQNISNAAVGNAKIQDKEAAMKNINNNINPS